MSAPLLRELVDGGLLALGLHLHHLGDGLEVAQQGHHAGDGALDALRASEDPGLAAELAAARVILAARTLAAKGELAAAIETLGGLDSAAADDLRASLLDQAGDLAGSLAALSALAARVVPGTGPLNEPAQDVLLRQATFAARVSDGPLLKRLQAEAPRMTGARADLFRVLIAPPVSSAADLPRAARELAAAQGFRKGLQ